MNSVMPQTHHTANFKTRQSQGISTGDTELPSNLSTSINRYTRTLEYKINKEG